MGTVLPRELMWRARMMYEEKEENGRRKFSMMQVAAHLGISETSVLRAVKNAGRFANINAKPLPEVMATEDLKKEGEIVMARMWELQQRINRGEEVGEPKRTDPYELYFPSKPATSAPTATAPLVAERTIPPSPLDGGDAPTESEGAGLTKLAQVMKAGDAMLDELNGVQQEKKDG